ncbi:MAG: sigma-70 family RNA polymerase sigma factor [Edaphobacter sp.]|uniref:RNA polymerase sigma factor n=1 Tax=Edaphobacter sp. TaxID=1934404 RepID=UPI0023A2F876|nr:sigma-70 family RNA polymerase sigma factor [Edaphobacter sp.]MDE1175430.1 sigma-70 family RNA polymerase sigma factor [Edaphobacter sp.]
MYRELGPANHASRSTSNDDADLLALIRRGDEHAMASLYDRYAKIVYSTALRVLRDPTSAEEILEAVFLQIWRTPEQFVAIRGSLGAWLTLLTRNRSIDAIRRKKPVEAISDIALAGQYDLSVESERQLMANQAATALLQLGADQRKTLDMAFFDGLTHAEISEMTSDSPAIVSARITGTLHALRKAFLA